MIALAYLATVAASMVVLAVVLFRRPGPVVPPDVPAPVVSLPSVCDADVRVVLAAVARLTVRYLPVA